MNSSQLAGERRGSRGGSKRAKARQASVEGWVAQEELAPRYLKPVPMPISLRGKLRLEVVRGQATWLPSQCG